jgi:hypothetical protein
LRVFALVEVGERQAIDLYVRREDAYAVLDEVLRAEPEWIHLHVLPLDLGEAEFSLN